MKSSKVISGTINGAKNMIIKVLRLGGSDVQTSNQIAPFGFDSNPVADLVAIHSETGVKGETIIIGYINKDHITEAGETRLFSVAENADLIPAYIHLKKSGILELNGDSNYAVKYNELETAFNQLKSDFDAHIHITTATVGASAVPGILQPVSVPSTADISPAKNTEIKTN